MSGLRWPKVIIKYVATTEILPVWSKILYRLTNTTKPIGATKIPVIVFRAKRAMERIELSGSVATFEIPNNSNESRDIDFDHSAFENEASGDENNNNESSAFSGMFSNTGGQANPTVRATPSGKNIISESTTSFTTSASTRNSKSKNSRSSVVINKEDVLEVLLNHLLNISKVNMLSKLMITCPWLT